jgi:hypothetical protein
MHTVFKSVYGACEFLIVLYTEAVATAQAKLAAKTVISPILITGSV